jgi:hypothetical protein
VTRADDRATRDIQVGRFGISLERAGRRGRVLATKRVGMSVAKLLREPAYLNGRGERSRGFAIQLIYEIVQGSMLLVEVV